MKKFLIVILSLVLSIVLGIGVGYGVGTLINSSSENDNQLVEGNDKNTENNTENNNQLVEDNNKNTENDNQPVEDNNENNKDEEYIFANSDKALIKEEELKELSKEKLEIAKNEIFARYGYDFSSKTLKEYFSKLSWYHVVKDKKIGVTDLNEIEQKNVVLLDKYIQIRLNENS